MNRIIIHRQSEYDRLPDRFETQTTIELIGYEVLTINKVAFNAGLVAKANSVVNLFGTSSITAMENSAIFAFDQTKVWASDTVVVLAVDAATVVAGGSYEDRVVVYRFANNPSLNMYLNDRESIGRDPDLTQCLNNTKVIKKNGLLYLAS